MGTRESLNGRKNVARRKVKNGEKIRLSKKSFVGFHMAPFFTFLRCIFFCPFGLSLVPTVCPWVSEDDLVKKRLLFKLPRMGLFSPRQSKHNTGINISFLVLVFSFPMN